MTKPEPLSAPDDGTEPAASSRARASPHLAALGEKARDYARDARAENTRRAYESDWRQFSSWLRRQGSIAAPDPRTVGLYLAACVEGRGARNIGAGRGRQASPTLERRLSGICWRYRQLGEPLDTGDRHIATVLAGIRRQHGRPPVQKEAIFADELLAMLATLDMDLRGLRDRAILAIGFAGGLRRSEIVGLDCGPEPERGRNRLDRDFVGADPGERRLAASTINGKTGWREVEIGRGSRPDTCPVALLETWMRLGRISHGPLFRPIARRTAASPPSD